MTIIGLLISGALFGVLTGALISPLKAGCFALLIVPVAMIAYVSLSQSLHPEDMRSTSALAYLFAPLWPSVGAIVGFMVGGLIRLVVVRRKQKVR